MTDARVWFDLSNSPHPLLFAPICKHLEAIGATPLITVRDHAQTVELARERWPDAEVVGSPSSGRLLAKGLGLVGRAGALIAWARRARPDVALSHNSYSQIVAARAVRIPVLTAMDYEHQPANHLAFRCADKILIPDAIPSKSIARQGATPRKVLRYSGFKEALYLRDFEPDSGVLERLGISRGATVAVARAAARGAAYHPGDNPLFIEALRVLADQPEVITVVLARQREQREEIERLRLPRLVFPSGIVDGRSLLCSADLFVGAGGTMSREAALLGIPAYSIFSGVPPAVDLSLERDGRLQRLESIDQLRGVRPQARALDDRQRSIDDSGRELEELFVRTAMSMATRGE